MIPQGFGMMKEMFPPRELQAAFGAMGPIMGLSAVGGPTLAGWLVDADFFGTGWRMIFLINLPIGLIAILAAIRFLPATRPIRSSGLTCPVRSSPPPPHCCSSSRWFRAASTAGPPGRSR